MLGMSWLRVLSETQVFIFVRRLPGTSHVVFQNAGVAVVLFLLDFFFSIEGKENLLPLSPAKFHYSFFEGYKFISLGLFSVTLAK